MAPVATAAANNPLLTTLTKAVSGQLNPNVNLVDTLNGVGLGPPSSDVGVPPSVN